MILSLFSLMKYNAMRPKMFQRKNSEFNQLICYLPKLPCELVLCSLFDARNTFVEQKQYMNIKRMYTTMAS